MEKNSKCWHELDKERSESKARKENMKGKTMVPMANLTLDDRDIKM